MRSDNISGVSEEILKAIIAENNGEAMAYGGDDATAFSEKILKNIFENDDLKSFNMVSGTATNSLILATLSPTFGAIFCHKNSHVYGDECGANEFQSGGAKLVTLDGENGKLIPSVLDDAISAHIIGEPHHSQPAVITLAQSTEAGTVYSLSEIKAISEIAKKHKLKLHMDGARFANAVASIGCSPAEMTWKSGVDALSFGTTKNGTLGAETAIFFNDSEDGSFKYRRMRAGHLLSKMRFVSAQVTAYLKDDLWLNNASNANAMAERLYQGIKDNNKVNFLYPAQSNVLFVDLEKDLQNALTSAGFIFYADGNRARLVTAFNTDVDYIDRFIGIVNGF